MHLWVFSVLVGFNNTKSNSIYMALSSSLNIKSPRCFMRSLSGACILVSEGGHCLGACRLQMFFSHPCTKIGPPFYVVIRATLVHREELTLESHTHTHVGFVLNVPPSAEILILYTNINSQNKSYLNNKSSHKAFTYVGYNF